MPSPLIASPLCSAEWSVSAPAGAAWLPNRHVPRAAFPRRGANPRIGVLAKRQPSPSRSRCRPAPAQPHHAQRYSYGSGACSLSARPAQQEIDSAFNGLDDESHRPIGTLKLNVPSAAHILLPEPSKTSPARLWPAAAATCHRRSRHLLIHQEERRGCQVNDEQRCRLKCGVCGLGWYSFTRRKLLAQRRKGDRQQHL